VRLNDSSVSRIHARIYWDTTIGAHRIDDCGSANGTFVNQVRIRGPVQLADGMTIRVGSTKLRYSRQ
jgi:pSer/pThr/pTyr-binding forkhead associated (FHA) protein